MDVDEGFKDEDGEMLVEVEDDGLGGHEEELPPTQDDASSSSTSMKMLFIASQCPSQELYCPVAATTELAQPAHGVARMICLEGHNDSVTA